MCMVPSKGCISQNNSPADGTSCGEKKVIYYLYLFNFTTINFFLFYQQIFE